jgi:hypothetical protein
MPVSPSGIEDVSLYGDTLRDWPMALHTTHCIADARSLDPGCRP